MYLFGRPLKEELMWLKCRFFEASDTKKDRFNQWPFDFLFIDLIKLKNRAAYFRYVINENFSTILHQHCMLVIANLNDDACTGKISTAELLAVSLKIGDRHFRLFIKVFLDIV